MRPDIKKRRDKYKEKSQAQKIFKKGTKILNERPEEMSQEEYRAARKMQTKVIQGLFPHQFDSNIASKMRPKQKSAHHIQMVKNAMMIKYGYLKNIDEEASENRANLESSRLGWFNRVLNRVRETFGRKSTIKQ